MRHDPETFYRDVSTAIANAVQDVPWTTNDIARVIIAIEPFYRKELSDPMTVVECVGASSSVWRERR